MGFVRIDGAHLAGGGQIVRTAVGLSAATGTPCRIVNVRKRRSRPGLAAQHLCGVRAVAQLCAAELAGDEVGSTELEFRPGALEPPERLSVGVGTAGSVTLVLQALIIPLAVGGRAMEVEVRGGTHVNWSPTTDYFTRVFGWFLGRMGVEVAPIEVRPGFYPKGGGRIRLSVRPGPLRPIALMEPTGEPVIRARSIASVELAKAQVAERQLRGVEEVLPVDASEFDYVQSASVGTAAFVRAEYGNCRLGASALGARGKPAETVGREAARLLERWCASGACLDEHMADQVLPYMALAGGESSVRVAGLTDHCRTNVWVIEQFLPVRFELDEARGLISCGR